MESKRPLAPSDNFDMTLEECRLVFDTMDNLIIIDERGRIKYFSPNMYSMVEAYNKRPLPDKVVGKHVSEVHPPLRSSTRHGAKSSTRPAFTSPRTSPTLPASKTSTGTADWWGPLTMTSSPTAWS